MESKTPFLDNLGSLIGVKSKPLFMFVAVYNELPKESTVVDFESPVDFSSLPQKKRKRRRR